MKADHWQKVLGVIISILLAVNTYALDLLKDGETPLKLTSGKQKELPFTLPAEEASGAVVLEFMVRVDIARAKANGWRDQLVVELNGERLTDMVDASTPRLLNKPRRIDPSGAQQNPAMAEVTWCTKTRHWTIFYSPDCDETKVPEYYRPKQGNPYQFVLAIDDLLKKDAPNTLTLISKPVTVGPERIPLSKYNSENGTGEATLIFEQILVRPKAPTDTIPSETPIN